MRAPSVSVYHRPNGTYSVRWRENGKQREERGYPTEDAALARKLEISRQLRDPFSRGRSEARTIRQLAADWYNATIPTGKVKPGTAEVYTRHLGLILKTPLADQPAADVTTAMINVWSEQLDTTPSTIRNMLVVLSSIYQYAISRGIGNVKHNPARGAERPTQRRSEITIPTTLEIVRLAIAVPEPDAYWRALLLTAAFAGLRQQECFALRWGSVTDEHIIVREALSAGTISDTKTETGARRVPLLPIVCTALAEAKADQFRADDDQLVWPTGSNGPWQRGTFLQNHWGAWRERAEVDVKWRHLRHFYASWLAASGAQPLQVSRWMGHTKFSFTMDTYGFLFDSDTDAIIKAANARIENA